MRNDSISTQRQQQQQRRRRRMDEWKNDGLQRECCCCRCCCCETDRCQCCCCLARRRSWRERIEGPRQKPISCSFSLTKTLSLSRTHSLTKHCISLSISLPVVLLSLSPVPIVLSNQSLNQKESGTRRWMMMKRMTKRMTTMETRKRSKANRTKIFADR